MSGLAAWIRAARERAEVERARADRAATIAGRHERLTLTARDWMRPVHERLGRVHRRSEERHLIAARLHDAHVQRLTRWSSTAAADVDRPRLIAAVADLLGARSAGITLLGSGRTEASVIASDRLAAAAQELEFTLGEGPIHDSTASSRPVVIGEDSLPGRWQQYSPAITALGVRSLAVVPLGPPGPCLGALAVFDPPRLELSQAGALEDVADALTHTMLLTEECIEQLVAEDTTADTGGLLDSHDRIVVVHQAAGMVAAQCNCKIEDAFSLIRARTFAQDTPVTEVARQIVEKRLRLDAP